MRGLIEVIEHWLGKLARFVERVGGRAESRAGAEAAEDAAARLGRRGEREAVEGAEHAAAQTARRGEREAAEATETAAERASQVVRLRLEARAFTEAAEKAHVPVVALIPSLDAWFMPRYRWLTGFISEPLPIPGHYRIAFTASAPTTFDPDYDPGQPITADRLRRQVAGIRLDTDARRRGLDLLNSLPQNDRDWVIAHLRDIKRASGPDAASDVLGMIGGARIAPDELVLRLRQARTAVVPRTGQVFEEGVEEGFHLIKRPPVLRVSPEEIRAGREALRRNMNQPLWADIGADWEAHHIIPVELQNHAAFDALTSRRPGWNHHDPRVNGIALPTTLEGFARSNLPVHQVNRELLEALRRTRGINEPIPPGVLQDLMFHPNYNRDANDLLDAAYESYLGHRSLDILRRDVLRARDTLLDRIVLGGDQVLL